jgi:hypothetical protein
MFVHTIRAYSNNDVRLGARLPRFRSR